MIMSNQARSPRLSRRARIMLAIAGVFVALALVSVWLAQPGPVLGRLADGNAVRDDTRLIHFGSCPMPGWITTLAPAGVIAVVGALCVLAYGIFLAVVRQYPPVPRSDGVALIVLAVAMGAWGLLTTPVAADAVSVCGVASAADSPPR